MSYRWLFVVQTCELKPIAQCAANVEVIQPILSTEHVSEHHVLSFEIDYDKQFKEQLRQVVDNLRKEIAGAPVVIYGAGLHTQQHLTLFTQLNLVAIADKDETLWGTELAGIEIISPDAIESVAEHVLISSKAFEEAIYSSMSAMLPKVIFHKLYDNAHNNSVHFTSMANDIASTALNFSPDIIFYSPAQPNDSLSADYWLPIKQQFPNTKFVSILWDYDEDEQGSPSLEFERGCLRWSDLCIENTNVTRLAKMREKTPPYQHHEHVERMHFIPTVFDPKVFFEDLNQEKQYDIALFGTAAGERKKWIEALQQNYGSRFHHIGGFLHGQELMSIEDYALALRKTRVCINTQTYPFREQYKGKVREAIASGVVLLEQRNRQTQAVLKDGQGILFFSTFEQLTALIDRILTDEQYRNNVVEQGRQVKQARINADAWTKQVLIALGMTV